MLGGITLVLSALAAQSVDALPFAAPDHARLAPARASGKAAPQPSAKPVAKPLAKPVAKPVATPKPVLKRKNAPLAKAAPAVPLVLGELPPLDPRAAAAAGVPLGLEQASDGRLRALLGAPRLVVWEGDARKLQFVGLRCVLDVYLYPPTPEQEPRVTYADARRATDGRRVDRGLCLASLIRTKVR